MPVYAPINTEELKRKTQAIIERELGAPDKRTGQVNFYKCPFHTEDTPSFAVYEDHAHCYGCGFHGDAFDFVARRYSMDFVGAAKYLNAQSTDGASLEEYRRQREEERRAQLQARDEARERYHTDGPWQRYHEALTDQARATWRATGIPHDWQDWWSLGFAESRKYEYKGEFFESPALTIPIWSLVNGHECHVITCQYRLLEAPADAGKYRFEADLGTAAWIARPDWKIGCGVSKVLVCEGFKKAANAYLALGEMGYQVVAIPAQRDTGGILPTLREFGEVVVWLDPDVVDRPQNAAKDWRPADEAICEMVGLSKSKYVRYPKKLDDAILQNGLTGADMLDIIKYTARRLKK
jgi:hypothetical protein